MSLVDGVPVLWPQPRLPSAGEWLASVLFVVSAQLGPHGVGPHVEETIDVNPEGCLMWANMLDIPVITALRTAGLLI